MEYSISRVDPEAAREEILSTWRVSFPDLPVERFDWIYRQNPAGRAATWLARTKEDDEVVGATALLCRTFDLAGGTCTAGISADFSVAPGHRGFGPAMALQRQTAKIVEEGGLAFAYGLPNRQAALLMRRAGYRLIGSVVHLTRLLRTGDALRRRVGNKAFTRPVAAVADVALGLRDTLRRAVRTTRRYRGTEIEAFDERFDALWEATRRDHPILGDRSARFLRWRFQQSPRGSHRVFGLVDADTGQLEGYVVYHTRAARTVVDDLLCRDLAERLDELLIRFARARRAEGDQTIAVSFFGTPHLVGALQRNDFAIRDDSSDPFAVCVPPEAPIARDVSDPERWWFFPADNDV